MADTGKVLVVWIGGQPSNGTPFSYSLVLQEALTLLKSQKAERGEEAV